MPNSPAPRRRDQAIDLMRATCILWIVGFWHLLGYAPSIDGYKNDLTYRLTVVVLGLFVFISGHLIGRARITNAAEVWRFYRRRMIRIYPPTWRPCCSSISADCSSRGSSPGQRC